jgi:hypothetical protein
MLGGYAKTPSSTLATMLSATPDRAARGVARFVSEDWSALSTETMKTYASPWKVITTGLLLYVNEERAPMTADGANQLLQRYGFFVPSRIANWPAALPPPRLDRPLGIVAGQLEAVPLSIEIVNNGCATCHSARGVDAKGNPTREAWLFAPSTSLDLDAYSRDVLRAFRGMVADDPSRFLAAVQQVHPNVTDAELNTIQNVILPAVRDRLKELGDRPSFVAYPIGEPGLTNGVASIKLLTGLLGADGGKDEAAFTANAHEHAL